MSARVSIIAAIGHNRVVGKDNDLLWHIPDDLKRFKELTLGHPVIMGRRTWESLPERVRPLPGRTNIVVTRDNDWSAEGALIAHSLEEALAIAKEHDQEEVFVIGGGQIYAQALPHTDRLYLTLIDDEKEGHVYFPPYESEFTNILKDEPREHEGLTYRWVDIER